MNPRTAPRGVSRPSGSGGTAGSCLTAGGGEGLVRPGICENAGEQANSETMGNSFRSQTRMMRTPWERPILAAQLAQEKAGRKQRIRRNAPDIAAARTGRSSRRYNRKPPGDAACLARQRSEEHTSELQSRRDLVCRLLLEKKKKKIINVLDHKKKKKNIIE